MTTTKKLTLVERDVLSRELVVVALKCDLNPLGDAVKISLSTVETQDDPEWLSSSDWFPDQTWVDKDTPVFAHALVGPGGGDMVIERGVTYTVKAKVTDNPEAPVIPCYQLKGI